MDEAAETGDARSWELVLLLHKYKQKSVVIPIQALKIPMYISVMSPLGFSRQSVGFVVGIQWRDSEEQSGWESGCWHIQAPKLFLFHLFFGFPHMKTALLALFCLNLFSFARIQSGGDNEKGSQAASGRGGARLPR